MELSEELLNYFNGDILAANVWLSKYAQEGETTPDDMHKRMAIEFAKIEKSYLREEESTLRENPNCQDLSDYGKSRKSLDEEGIYNLFKDFKYVIPQGSIMSQLGAKSIGSLSNCFVIGQPEDSYGGIFQKDEEMAQLMKRRGGVGLDVSTLRPNKTAVTNAAQFSSGVVSFMERYSNTTREVAQEGRRGALMLSLSVNHPDVLEFIKVKRDLTKITGANISIKLNDEFMKAVENEEDYILRFPCEQKFEFDDSFSLAYDTLINVSAIDGVTEGYVKRVKAREYWDELIKSAHGVAEPGIMFEDNHINYSPDGVYDQYRGITTNPCGEIFMQEYDACRLIAMNLFSFVDNPFTKEATFNFQKFYNYNYEAMRLSDDLIDLELEHIQRILDKLEADTETEEVKYREIELWINVYKTAKASRRTGLGFTGLGDMLAALGMSYDSREGLIMAELVMKTKMESELDCTIDLAILRGTFDGWDPTKEDNDFYRFIANKYPDLASKMATHGRRNVSWSTVAPTGTVSLLAQVTSGMEPLYAPYNIRRKKVNPDTEGVRVDFTDQNGDTWQEFAVIHEKFKDWIHQQERHDNPDYFKIVNRFPNPFVPMEYTREELAQLFKLSPWYGSTAEEIDWGMRGQMQSTIQTYISHSISSTINLPEDISTEVVSDIYLNAWESGLKGITVYRDGSRSGVLIKESKRAAIFEQNDATKRPKSLVCDVHQTSSRGTKWNVIVGLLDDKPYEVFAVPHFTGEQTLELTKVKKGRYDLVKEGETFSENIISEMSYEEGALTRLISVSLRHGADIKYIVEQLNKSEGDITSFAKSIARTLKKYIPEGAKSTVSCNECGSGNVIFQEGCLSCQDCGTSLCS